MKQFQSTRPMRGATFPRMSSLLIGGVSIHAPRAGRDQSPQGELVLHQVSIHAPRVGRDCGDTDLHAPVWVFQSTRPVRGATRFGLLCGFNPRVSIHAPRAGRDFGEAALSTDRYAFQSTRPVRGATAARTPSGRSHVSQSTRPVRGATAEKAARKWDARVSIHAPHAGRDSD